MKRFLAVLLFVSVLLSLTACGLILPKKEEEIEVYTGNRKIMVADQKNKRVSIYDLRNEDWTVPAWSWTSTESTFTYVDGLKYRYDPNEKTDVIAVCSSGGYCAVVSYPVGEVLAYVPNAGGNPHSVEILPDGALVVAASDGAYIRIYDTSEYGDISSKYTQTRLDGAHGVLWDPEKEVLWALGNDVLCAYRISKDHKLTECSNMVYPLPIGGGHDLQPVPGNHDLLWVTVNSGVYQFSKSEEKFLVTYNGSPTVALQGGVKGIGSFEDGLLVMAIANGTWKSWNTDCVTVGTYDPETNRYILEERKIPGAIYKLRVFDRNYQ